MAAARPAALISINPARLPTGLLTRDNVGRSGEHHDAQNVRGRPDATVAPVAATRAAHGISAVFMRVRWWEWAVFELLTARCHAAVCDGRFHVANSGIFLTFKGKAAQYIAVHK